MATWLAGWVAGWLSISSGIVYKRLNLSLNFVQHLVAPSFEILWPIAPIPDTFISYYMFYTLHVVEPLHYDSVLIKETNEWMTQF